MNTSIQHDTVSVHGAWALTRETVLGIVLMGTLGALAGFLCARFLWM